MFSALAEAKNEIKTQNTNAIFLTITEGRGERVTFQIRGAI